METLMVDMDNVITDGLFINLIEEFYNKKIDLNSINNYYFVQELTRERNKEFWEYVSTKNFYGDAPLLDGCYEVLEKLNSMYDIYIATSYLWNEIIDLSGKNLMDKYIYLKDNLPFIEPEKYIFVTNKNLLNFDIRIDDKISNLNEANTKLLFTAWHNKNVSAEKLNLSNIKRVNNWYEIEEELITKKLERKIK